MSRDFWPLIERMAPSMPESVPLSWAASLSTIRTILGIEGFIAPVGVVRLALESAAEWNPGFPWNVAVDYSGRVSFRPKPGNSSPG